MTGITPELWDAMTWSEVTVECGSKGRWFHKATELPTQMMEEAYACGEILIGGMHGPNSRTVYPRFERPVVS